MLLSELVEEQKHVLKRIMPFAAACMPKGNILLKNSSEWLLYKMSVVDSFADREFVEEGFFEEWGRYMLSRIYDPYYACIRSHLLMVVNDLVELGKNYETTEKYEEPENKIVAFCILCSQRHEINVKAEGYEEWKRGAVRIQEVLPETPADERELLISGICGKCFDETFADEDDEDED